MAHNTRRTARNLRMEEAPRTLMPKMSSPRGEEIANVFRQCDGPCEKRFIHLALPGRTVRSEVRKVHYESCTDALAVGVERKKLHPARIDADERLVGGRGQTGH